MVEWKLVFTKQAQKDAKKIKTANLKVKTLELLEILTKNLFQNPLLLSPAQFYILRWGTLGLLAIWL